MKINRMCIINVLLLCLVFAASAQAFDSSWTQWNTGVGANGHWYKVVNVGANISWTSANTAANAILGNGSSYLATITSAQENAFVFGLVNNSAYWSGQMGPWLGGYSPVEANRKWNWVTSESFTYTNWGTGQPNYIPPSNAAMYLHFWNNGNNGSTPFPLWADTGNFYSGYIPKAYVVEAVVPEPMSVMLGIMGLGSIAGFKRLRKK